MNTTSSPDFIDPSLSVGNATVQSSTWVGAWSKTGISAQHKANLASATEAWSAVKYTDLLATALAGGDISGGDLGVSGQSYASSTVRQEIDGSEALRFTLAHGATALTLNLSRLFTGDDGSAYAEAGRVRLFDSSGALVGQALFHAADASGSLAVQLATETPFVAIEISAGALRADGSFALGAYANLATGAAVDLYADAGGKHGSDFLVHALAVSNAPARAAADSYTVDEDGTLAGASVLANDSSPSGQALSATLVDGPAHGTLSFHADGSFTYLPNADFSGQDAFSYRAIDAAGASAPTTVALTVNAVNDAPVVQDETATVAQDSVATPIGVLGNDRAGPADEAAQTLTVTGASALHGTVAIDSGGVLLYTPDAHYTGADTITYAVTDNGSTAGLPAPLTAQGHVAVTVAALNHAPSAAPDSAATNEDSSISGNVLNGTSGGADTDPDGDTLTVASAGTFTSALGAVVTLAADGSFVYDPRTAAALQALNNGQSSIDGFDYTVTDGHGGSSSAHVSVSVSGITDVTQAGTLEPVTPAAHQLYMRYIDHGTASAWIAIDHFNTAFQATLVQAGSGLVAMEGQPVASGFTVLSSTAATILNNRLLAGEHLDLVQVQAISSIPGKPTVIEDTVFSDVAVTAADGGNAATSYALSYADYSSRLTPLLASGKPGPVLRLDSGGMEGELPHPPGSPLSSPLMDQRGELHYSMRLNGTGGWYDLASFQLSLGAQADGTRDASVTMSLDGLSWPLLKALLDTRTSASVEIESYMTGDGAARLVDDYSFSNVTFTGLGTSELTGSAASFHFGSYTQGHNNYNSSGTVSNWVSTGYDLQFERSISGPAPVASAAAPAPLTPDGLTVYMRYMDHGTLSKWIAVPQLNSNLSVLQSGTGTSGGAASVQLDGTSLGLMPSEAVQTLTARLLDGNVLDSVEFQSFAVTRGQSTLVSDTLLGNVHVTSASTAAQADTAWNGFALEYSAYSSALAAQRQDGSYGPMLVNEYNVGEGIPHGSGTALTAPIMEQQGQLHYAMRLNGTGGWYDLTSFALQLDPAAGTRAGLNAAATVSFDGMSTTVLRDLLAPAAGKADVEIEAYTINSSKPQLVDEYQFHGVVYTSLATGTDSGSTAQFQFEQYTQGHNQYNPATGSFSGFSGTGIDLVEGAMLHPSPPHADRGAPASVAPGSDDVFLRYIDHGRESDWIRVGNFSTTFANEMDAGGTGMGSTGGHPTGSSLVLQSNAGTQALLGKLFSGSSLASVEIQVLTHMGLSEKPTVTQDILLGGVRVVDAYTAAGGSTATTFNLAYTDYAATLTPRTASGFGTPQTTRYGDEEIVHGAGTALNAGFLDDHAELHYYLQVNGTGGWYDLSEFGLKFGNDGNGPLSVTDAAAWLSLNGTAGKLLQTLVAPKGLLDLEVEAYETRGGVQLLVDEYHFSDAAFSNIDTDPATGMSANFRFEQVMESHNVIRPDGTVSGFTGSGYDLTQAELIAPVAPHADLFV